MDLLPFAEIELEDLPVDATANKHAVVGLHGSEARQQYRHVLALSFRGHHGNGGGGALARRSLARRYFAAVQSIPRNRRPDRDEDTKHDQASAHGSDISLP